MERAPDRPSTRTRTGFPPERPGPSPLPSGPPRPRRTAVRTAGAGAAVLAALAVAPAARATPTGEPVRLPADGLAVPWEIAPAPDGRTFVVERDGGIRVLRPDDTLQAAPALARTAFPGITVRKLLGFVLAPDFATSGLAYVYVTTTRGSDTPGPSGVWRLRARPDGGFDVVDRVFDGIDSDGNHDGGRMVFGPDGALYVTTGDIHQPTRPQDPQNLNGKILRLAVSASGPATAPADNPFVGQGGNARFVWSLGHRHPQGLAFDAAGRLWETEHGPTGEQHGPQYPGGNGKQGRDELNLVVKGGNYGWPVYSGPDNGPGFVAPAAVGPDDAAWAPGDLAVGADGSLYAPFLRGERLERFDVRQGAVFAQASHVRNLGRLRVAVARGSELLIARDGTGGIYRVPLSGRTPGGSDAADPPLVPPAPAPGPPSAPGPSAPVDPTAQVRARTKALGAKLRDAVRRLGARRLAAGRTVSVKAPGPSAGRTTIELRLRSSRGPLLARVRPRTASAATQRYRVRLGPVGRKRLRAATTRRLVVRVVHRRTAGTSATYATAVRIAPVRR